MTLSEKGKRKPKEVKNVKHHSINPRNNLSLDGVSYWNRQTTTQDEKIGVFFEFGNQIFPN